MIAFPDNSATAVHSMECGQLLPWSPSCCVSHKRRSQQLETYWSVGVWILTSPLPVFKISSLRISHSAFHTSSVRARVAYIDKNWCTDGVKNSSFDAFISAERIRLRYDLTAANANTINWLSGATLPIAIVAEFGNAKASPASDSGAIVRIQKWFGPPARAGDRSRCNTHEQHSKLQLPVDDSLMILG